MSRRPFALQGGNPMFSDALPVGQLYFPSWERYRAAMQGIFDRRYYTNQGPLVDELEERLQNYLNVPNVICVTNATIGLMMAAEAMDLGGKVILPSFTFIASAQSLSWCGIEPLFCDVDSQTHQIDTDRLQSLLDEDVQGIMAVNLWGGTCDIGALESFAKQNDLRLYFDSAHAFGCETRGRMVGGFGSLEVFSFHATKVLSATEGGCLCTDDDDLAARLRNIRSSYGAGRPVSVVKTSNGRMSEAQAAVALMSLDDFPMNRRNNEMLYHRYASNLKEVSGIKIVKPADVSVSNYQYAVFEVDEEEFGMSRDALLGILKSENINARRYFYPGVHRHVEFRGVPSANPEQLPVTEKLCGSCMQLPIGALTDLDTVDRICGLVSDIGKSSDVLLRALAEIQT